MKTDIAPVEFIIKVDARQLSLHKGVYCNGVAIEKKLRELMRLFHPNLACSFCAELISEGKKIEIVKGAEFSGAIFEIEGWGEFPKTKKKG